MMHTVNFKCVHIITVHESDEEWLCAEQSLLALVGEVAHHSLSED